MAKETEILMELKPLSVAFGKHFNEEEAELWVTELREYTPDEIRRAVRSFLDSPGQKTFPRIGEFKAASGREKREGKGSGTSLPSCPRCMSGLCSVRRMVGQYPVPVNFTFRCSCLAGSSNYPGLPLVSSCERTHKEEVAEKKAAWAAGSRAG